MGGNTPGGKGGPGRGNKLRSRHGAGSLSLSWEQVVQWVWDPGTALGQMGKRHVFACSHLYAGMYQTEQSFPASQRSLLDCEILEDRLGILFILCGPVPHPGNNSNSNNSSRCEIFTASLCAV